MAGGDAWREVKTMANKGGNDDVKLTGKDPGGKLNGILGRGSDPKNK
jgi:hypothetical protein